MSSTAPQRPCFQFAASGNCRFGVRCKFVHIPTNNTFHIQQGGPSQNRQRHQRRSSPTHLDEFFGQYPDFCYNPSAPVMSEFYRMCDFFSWERDDDDREEAHGALKDAMTHQFNRKYGTDVDNLASWQALCIVLKIFPIPVALDACRDRVKQTHVNIVDLVDTRGQQVRVFNSVQELSTYTKETGKYFPKENAYAGGVLRLLLHAILNPPAVVVSRTRPAGGGRGRGRRNARG
ncbi:hypothetical protein PILCRDRAFT_456282 [Piloderma croceum F 1598]|uniref:C3H1-type domain-containing protein n=1 Tax=Piloderma croceum (strain F 1598) TaxID=765440 RepID=A0A0C3FEE3_PILCF|nr:hypothetical protein PILCRDRAFT_456282 [Piloderma croceum F 1598]